MSMGRVTSHTEFEAAEATRGRPKGQSRFGLTVVEAEISRSTKVADMGIYGPLLTHGFQNGQKFQNRTKNDKVLLVPPS